ncbi:hypothetical protein EMCRGX_G011463, partial [Ephydatia muelleri]
VTTIGSGVNGQVGCQPGHGSGRASLPKLSYVFLANGMQDQPNSCMASESIVVELVGLLHGASLSCWHNLPKMAEQSGDVASRRCKFSGSEYLTADLGNEVFSFLLKFSHLVRFTCRPSTRPNCMACNLAS